MKYINISIAFIFLLFALVQLNDPDPFVWLIFYGGVAILALMNALDRKNPTVLLLAIGMCLGGMLLLFPAFFTWLVDTKGSFISEEMSSELPWVETVREFFGLLISLITVCYLYGQK